VTAGSDFSISIGGAREVAVEFVYFVPGGPTSDVPPEGPISGVPPGGDLTSEPASFRIKGVGADEG